MVVGEKKRLYLPVLAASLLCLYYILPKTIAIVLEFVLLIFAFNKGRSNGQTRYPIIWYLFFAITLTLINILFGIDDKSVGYLTTCTNCLLFVVILSFSINCNEDIDAFITSFALSGFVFCLFLIPLISMAMVGGGARMGDAGGAEHNAFLSSSISIGYMTVLINICQFRCLTNTSFSKKTRFVFMLLFIFSFFCILMSGTRKALFASIFFILLYTYFVIKINFLKMLFYTIVLAFFLYALYRITLQVEFLYLVIGQRIEGLIGFFDPNYAEVDDSTLARKQLIDTGREIYKNNILFGAGIKQTQYLLNGASHPHNNYLSCLDFGGLISFIAYYILLIKAGISYFKKKVFDRVDMCMMGVIAALLLTDYAATTYNIIVFPSFLAIVYYKSKFPSVELNK